MRLLWSFDFDGVVCHSAKELCISAWAGARRLWPEHTRTWPQRPSEIALEAFYHVRPVVETGWESMLLNRALHEGGYDPPTVLRDWTSSLRSKLLSDYGHPPETYMQVFHDVRSDWMAADEEGWLAENAFYPKVVESIQHLLKASPPIRFPDTDCEPVPPVFVITTKGKEFALKLLRRAGLGGIPESHVYGLGSGKKVDVLHKLLGEHSDGQEETRVVFVEDRLQTLHGVMQRPDVTEKADLVLAGWGYNTEEERAAAASDGKITFVPTEQAFCDWVHKKKSTPP